MTNASRTTALLALLALTSPLTAEAQNLPAPRPALPAVPLRVRPMIVLPEARVTAVPAWLSVVLDAFAPIARPLTTKAWPSPNSFWPVSSVMLALE